MERPQMRVADSADGYSDRPGFAVDPAEVVGFLGRRLGDAVGFVGRVGRLVGDVEDFVREGTLLARDARARISAVDDGFRTFERLLERVERIDYEALSRRVSRLEEAVLNIEQASVTASQKFDGLVAVLPDRLARSIEDKGESESRLPPADRLRD